MRSHVKLRFGRRAIALLAFCLIGLLAYCWLLWRDDYALCERIEPKTLTGPTGDVIDIDTRLCSALTGDPGTVVVRFRRGADASGRIIFAYNPAAGSPSEAPPPWYPEVTWRGPNRIEIAIDRIAHIQRQNAQDGDVRFTYRIGSVDYR